MTNLKTNRNRLIALVACVVIYALSIMILSPHSHARQDKLKPIEQGWRVVADIMPVNLQEELKKLNEQGVAVPKDSIRVIGDRFVIIINDDDAPTNEDEDSDQ